MKKSMFVVFIALVAIVLTGCAAVSPNDTTVITQLTVDLSTHVYTACHDAAVSVFGSQNPILVEKEAICIEKLSNTITNNDGLWLKPGTLPMYVARSISNYWGINTNASVDRILAAMKKQRYVLEDNGLMVKDPSEIRDDPQLVLDGSVLSPAEYPWLGTILDGENLTYTLGRICLEYTRSTNDDCTNGAVLWQTANGDYLIVGQAFDYLAAVDNLPVAQPGDIVKFGTRESMTPFIEPNTVFIETESGYTEGYSVVLRVTYPLVNDIQRKWYSYANETWETLP